jgi:hypothetical protein
MVSLESLRSLLSNDIKLVQIGAQAKKLWLQEVRVSEQFFCVFQVKILAKPEMLLTNRELHVATEVALFLKVPNSQINSQQVGKTLCAKMVPREEKPVGFPARFPYFRRFSRAQLT